MPSSPDNTLQTELEEMLRGALDEAQVKDYITVTLSAIKNRLPKEEDEGEDLYYEMSQQLDKKTWEFAKRHWQNAALADVKQALDIESEGARE